MNDIMQNEYFNFLMKLDKVKHKEIYAKIIALSLEEAPLETVEGRITGGSVNIDGASSVRRTCSLTLVAQNFNYSNYLWGLNTKFNLQIGVKNNINSNYPDIIWFDQGIFVISSFNVSRSTTNFTVNISGKDKMCLLNGEFGGVLESSIDFGVIKEEKDGVWISQQVPIYDIIKNIIHVYGNEPYHNIIINDLDTYGLELLEYRYDTPLYLWRNPESLIYDNVVLENDDLKLYLKEGEDPDNFVTLSDLTINELESLTTTLTNNEPIANPVYTLKDGEYTPWYFTKIKIGDTAGYREKELVYNGDLITKVGETITSVLDKIKNMLVEFEYFYNLKGQFVFQKKQSFISTIWQLDDKNTPTLPSALSLDATVDYIFSGGELVTAFNNNPNIANIKNDFSIWGERQGVSGAKIPVHLRYAIDIKPTSYTSFEVDYGTYKMDGGKYLLDQNGDKVLDVPGKDYELIKTYNDKHGTKLKGQPRITYTIDQYDWREIIYRMAEDYFKYNFLDDFEIRIAQANPSLYPFGITGYEKYYTDLQGFWRELYYPGLNTELTEITEKYNLFKNNIDILKEEIYGKEIEWSENKLGGLENDIQILKNLLSKDDNESYTLAQKLIKYWNSNRYDEALNSIYPELNFSAPKYNLKDLSEQPISDPVLYFGMIQDYYFRQKNTLNEQEEKFKYFSKIKNEMEENINKNYYSDISNLTEDTLDLLYWNKNVYETPELLNFWFDFLDCEGELKAYSVKTLGSRSKAIQDSNIKSIYFRETPAIIFKSFNDNNYNMSGFRYIQIPSIENMFIKSAQGKSAKDKLDELLYQHACINETATLTTVPIYYLEPNCRVKVYDDLTNLNGDFIVNKITIPLTYNGTMTLNLTKVIEKIL